MKRAESVLILCLASLCLSACALRNAGPCYGIGCPAFTLSKSAPDQTSTTQHAQTRKSRHQKAKSAASAPSPTKQGE